MTAGYTSVLFGGPVGGLFLCWPESRPPRPPPNDEE